MLGKPEAYVMVMINLCHAMSFAGSVDPCGYVELKSLGLPDQQTREFSSLLCTAIEDELGIPSERIYIEFSAPARHMFGWNKATF